MMVFKSKTCVVNTHLYICTEKSLFMSSHISLSPKNRPFLWRTLVFQRATQRSVDEKTASFLTQESSKGVQRTACDCNKSNWGRLRDLRDAINLYSTAKENSSAGLRTAVRKIARREKKLPFPYSPPPPLLLLVAERSTRFQFRGETGLLEKLKLFVTSQYHFFAFVSHYLYFFSQMYTHSALCIIIIHDKLYCPRRRSYIQVTYEDEYARAAFIKSNNGRQRKLTES